MKANEKDTFRHNGYNAFANGGVEFYSSVGSGKDCQGVNVPGT